MSRSFSKSGLRFRYGRKRTLKTNSHTRERMEVRMALAAEREPRTRKELTRGLWWRCQGEDAQNPATLWWWVRYPEQVSPKRERRQVWVRGTKYSNPYWDDEYRKGYREVFGK